MTDKAQSPETLWDLIQDLWSIRYIIILGAVIGLFVGLAYTIISQKTYKVTMVVGSVPALSNQVQTSTQNTTPLSQNATEIQNLSQMRQNMYQTIFRSPRVADMILKLPAQIRALAQDKKYGLFSITPENWTNEDLSRYFHRSIRITPVQNTNDLIRIGYTHPDPDFARSFLLQLHALTDESIRNDHKKLINDRRAYITNALGKTYNEGHKIALGNVLIELEREAIMVNSDRSFSMRIINPPAASSVPHHPRTKIIILAMMLLGSFIGILSGFIRQSIRQE